MRLCVSEARKARLYQTKEAAARKKRKRFSSRAADAFASRGNPSDRKRSSVPAGPSLLAHSNALAEAVTQTALFGTITRPAHSLLSAATMTHAQRTTAKRKHASQQQLVPFGARFSQQPQKNALSSILPGSDRLSNKSACR